MDQENQTEETNLPDAEEVYQNDTGESYADESNDQTDADDENEEIEFNSKAYKLPREIASAVKDMQKDYTTKTQAVAEQRKEFEAQAQFHQENIKEVAQLQSLDSNLAEFAQLDWMTVSQQDPAMFQQLAAQQKQLEAKRNELAGNLNAKFQKTTQERQLQEAKLTEESESEIKRIIKDWSPDLDSKLQRFAADRYGFPREHVSGYKKDPKLAKMLHDAYIGQQIIQKQISNKPKTVDAKPVTNLSAKSTVVNKNPATMSPAEYAKWRRAGYK